MSYYSIVFKLYIEDIYYREFKYNNQYIDNIKDVLMYFKKNIRVSDSMKKITKYKFIDNDKLLTANIENYFDEYTYKIFKIEEIDILQEEMHNKKRKL